MISCAFVPVQSFIINTKAKMIHETETLLTYKLVFNSVERPKWRQFMQYSNQKDSNLNVQTDVLHEQYQNSKKYSLISRINVLHRTFVRLQFKQLRKVIFSDHIEVLQILKSYCSRKISKPT